MIDISTLVDNSCESAPSGSYSLGKAAAATDFGLGSDMTPIQETRD